LVQVRVTLLFPEVADKREGALPGLDTEQTEEAVIVVDVVVVDVMVGTGVGVGLGFNTLTLVFAVEFA